MLEPYSREKEEGVRKFWKDKGIPKKARALNRGKKSFYFMDGPPYASGHIHMGTALNKILKDIAIRSKRMQGLDARDQPGYDTHGLPIENKVEQKFNIKCKSEIETFGIEKFVKECRKFATEHIEFMNDEFENLGVWMDWENPYLTLDNSYIEGLWWTFKKAEEKGLLYLGKYPVHVCPRCATAVAYNEIEYRKQTDNSVYVKFPLKGEEGKFFIIWTTTPWTLPGNMGIMAHPKFDYVEVEAGEETWILAKERVRHLMDSIEAGFLVKREFKGKELEGKEYINPLAKNLKLGELKGAYRVIMSERYVNLEEGTGLVHTAPGHGKEDFDAGSKAGLPIVCPVEINGSLNEAAGKYRGGIAREIDKEIIEDLEKDNAVVYRHPYTHDYPICWRCKSPLLMVATPQWFFRITKIRKRLIELNKEVTWIPSWSKDRFKNWLESLGDWPVSRQRYWGTPLPIWVCGCGERKVVASRKELEKLAAIPKGLDLHKPYIDEVIFPCGKCKGAMKRVPEVLDVWFDSGASSWASLGYPGNGGLFKKFWPADLNIEAKDQIRGWWNSQLITSAICFDEKPFKAVMMHSTILDMGKKKMSKSLGNIVTPFEVIEKYSRDYLRFYLSGESKGEDIMFDWGAFRDVHRFFNIFWNTYNYIELYLGLDPGIVKEKVKLEPEDKWLLSRLNRVIGECREAYNKYHYPKIRQGIEQFVMEDLSRTYIKLVKDRVGTKTEKAAKKTLNIALMELVKLLAPVTPHISEYVYRGYRTRGMEESVHLLELPEQDKKMPNSRLEKEMAVVQASAQALLSMREENRLRLRWPLKGVVVESGSGKELASLKGVLAKMINVKEASEMKKAPSGGNYAVKEVGNVKVHLNIDSEGLKDEWELRELTRKVQAMRKEAKLNPNDRVELFLGCSDPAFIKKFAKEIEKDTNSRIKDKKGNMEKLLDRHFFIELGEKAKQW